MSGRKCHLKSKKLLGKGGFGYTYEVEDIFNGEKYAYKTFKKENAFLRSIVEIDIFFRIRSECLIKGIKLFAPIGMGEECLLSKKDGENGGIVMELEQSDIYYETPLFDSFFEKKKDLFQNLNGNEILDLKLSFILKVLYQVSCGIECLHLNRYFHRDVKLANILYSFNNKTKEINFFLTDFGLCYPIRSDSSIIYDFEAGTSSYLPPEYYSQNMKLDNKTDVFALGITIFRLLVGNKPFLEIEEVSKDETIDYKSTSKNAEKIFRSGKIKSSLFENSEKILIKHPTLENKTKEKLQFLNTITEKMLSFSSEERPFISEIINEILSSYDEFQVYECFEKKILFEIEDFPSIKKGIDYLLHEFTEQKLKQITLTICLFIRVLFLKPGYDIKILIDRCMFISRIFYSKSQSLVQSLSDKNQSHLIEIINALSGEIFSDPISEKLSSRAEYSHFFRKIVKDKNELLSFLNEKGEIRPLEDEGLLNYRLRKVY